MGVFAEIQSHPHTVYIVSDLHLGGAPPKDGAPGFQMCPPRSRAALAQFIHWIIREHAFDPGGAELVINGDFIDFLAEQTEEGFAAFTDDPKDALQKLTQAIEHTDAALPERDRVFTALRALTGAGCRLTVVLGNHDLEFAWPEVRERLRHELTGGKPAHLRLYLDGEALRMGNLMIEHGNRYDGWNWVNHRSLRELRAQNSREEPEVRFEPPPGSVLVQRVMNPLKARYAFIDLLKPEHEGVLPLLAVLEPDCLGELKKIASLIGKVVSASRKLGSGSPQGTKIATGGIREAAADLEVIPPEHNTKAVLEQLHSRWSKKADTKISTGSSWLDSKLGLWRIRSGKGYQERLERLHEALRETPHILDAPFAVGSECEPYRTHAARLANEQPRVVVFGHTHLPKRELLNGNGGLYLNTGTWCPIIRLPATLYRRETPQEEALALLGELTKELANNRLERWLAFHFTFARIELDLVSGHVRKAALFEFLPGSDTPLREVSEAETLPVCPEG